MANQGGTDVKYIDASVYIGEDLINHEVVNHERFIVHEKVTQIKDADSLIEYMDYAGIERAVVGHRVMIDLDPTLGNEILLDEVNKYRDRLIPTFTILPAITDAEFAPNPFFDNIRKSNVKVLRAYPEVNRYLLNAVTMGEQLGFISDFKIPLYLESRYGFEYIYSVLNEFPELTVVISNIGCWPSARLIYPLLQAYKNVYFETGDFTMMRGYEDLCSRFGSERALFGTNFPTNNMGCAMSALNGAKISDCDKINVAHKNMERLLGEVRL